ncbi:uncharacterized protein Z519_12212 [Cladophialophora bantiana CBS 173.52]|uniref:Uncharacterized protein n=1 Tax=Cladophialophora bantiana (strain ATCC 10958 / CBS 173.52 / CDC B-1940 / NIH 8579) TaxID=1442370 RepID=A0A0D2EAG8_CLAB1|nr:uncharacterized protein Z519_12212 [Cladophialophora bantiana CBS 173.52]KIW87101.1 hypothetical protein Z519_12212 [Cladophialophora bantiana CBS 173.52]
MTVEETQANSATLSTWPIPTISTGKAVEFCAYDQKKPSEICIPHQVFDPSAVEDLASNQVDAIVSAYGLTEYELDSALARTNQTPYETLFHGAQTSEMSGKKMPHM